MSGPPAAGGPRTPAADGPFDPTGQAVREVSRSPARRARCCLLAEIAAGLRICGTVRPQPGQPAVEAVFAGYLPARRLRTAVAAASGSLPLLAAGPAGASPGTRRLLVTVTGREAAELIRMAGLTGPGGRQLIGMPQPAMTGRRCDCAAAWRGAFLAAGTLSAPHRRPRLKVACPSREAALALAGAGRRLGVTATVREYGGTPHAAVATADDITRLLAAIGGPVTAREWRGRWDECQAQAADRKAREAGGHNLDRVRQAAAVSAARARRALDILGEDAPGSLRDAALLRIKYPEASLSRLGALAGDRGGPRMSKDAIASRLTRLFKLADARAGDGVPPPALAQAS